MARSRILPGLFPVIGKSITRRLEAGLFGSALTLSRVLGCERAGRLGAALMRRAGPLLSKHRHVRTNLAIAMKDRGALERTEAAREVWATLGATLMELPHLQTIIDSRPFERLGFCLACDLTPYQQRQRAAVFIAPHLGNWEITAAFGQCFGIDLSVVYSAQSNCRIDSRVQLMRVALGCKLIEKKGAARTMLQTLKSKRSLGLVMDARTDEGVEIDFFGSPAIVPTAAIALARRTDADIVPAHVERLPDCRFRVHIGAPLAPARTDASEVDIVLDLTKQVFAQFETAIARNPGQWLCVKRRWPKSEDDKKHRLALLRTIRQTR